MGRINVFKVSGKTRPTIRQPYNHKSLFSEALVVIGNSVSS